MNYAELLAEIGEILTASEREVFATKAIIRLSERNDALSEALKDLAEAVEGGGYPHNAMKRARAALRLTS